MVQDMLIPSSLKKYLRGTKFVNTLILYTTSNISNKNNVVITITDKTNTHTLSSVLHNFCSFCILLPTSPTKITL